MRLQVSLGSQYEAGETRTRCIHQTSHKGREGREGGGELGLEEKQRGLFSSLLSPSLQTSVWARGSWGTF